MGSFKGSHIPTVQGSNMIAKIDKKFYNGPGTPF